MRWPYAHSLRQSVLRPSPKRTSFQKVAAEDSWFWRAVLVTRHRAEPKLSPAWNLLPPEATASLCGIDHSCCSVAQTTRKRHGANNRCPLLLQGRRGDFLCGIPDPMRAASVNIFSDRFCGSETVKVGKRHLLTEELLGSAY